MQEAIHEPDIAEQGSRPTVMFYHAWETWMRVYSRKLTISSTACLSFTKGAGSSRWRAACTGPAATLQPAHLTCILDRP